MGLFHRHSWSTFTCTANEIEGIKFISAKDIINKTQFCVGNPTDHRCPDHPSRTLRSDGECYSCNYKIATIDLPNLSDILITYKKCLTCGVYDVEAQCGKYKYVVNKEYVKLKIESVKKEKDEAEMERLLNLGNPDYKPSKPSKSNDEKLKEYEKIIEEQKKSIAHLQTYLRTTLKKLNASLKNDGIWEAIPHKVRKDLIAKYGERATTYEPLSLEDITNYAMQNNMNS
jgi:hypothetical protein